MKIKKLLRKIQRNLNDLFGDKGDELYWKYNPSITRLMHVELNPKSSYLDFGPELHPRRNIFIKKMTHHHLFESFLEIGCANGINLKIINENTCNARLEGVDINKRALKEGVKHFKSVNATNIKLRYKPAKKLNLYDSQEFDVVFSSRTLTYISPDNIDKVLENMIRISSKSVFLCEYHTDGDSFYNDKWIHNYESILKNFSSIQSVSFHPIADNIDDEYWAKYGKIIEIKKYE